MFSVPRSQYCGPYRHLVTVYRRALEPAQAQELARTAIALGLEPVYVPGALELAPFSWMAQTATGA